MIKRLQRKFVMISMASIITVLAIVLSAVMIVNSYRLNAEANMKINIISEYDGIIPEINKLYEYKLFAYQLTPEAKFEIRFFTIKLDHENSIIQIDVSHIASVNSDEAISYASIAAASNTTQGIIDNYKFKIIDKPYGKLIVFLDITGQIRNKSALLLTSISVSSIGMLLVFIIVSRYSKKAIKPIIESIEKQNRFITDAGHELKTPLTIIAANTDVLEYSIGDNEWLKSIKNQTQRLDKLIKNLLLLAKIEESGKDKVFSDFSISDAVSEEAAPFATVAEQNNKSIICDIQPNLSYHGDESSIRNLISILLDNAIKYSLENSHINICLKEHSHSIKLEIKNKCNFMSKTETDKLFDRFYRSDTSRSRETGGNGIGLSIAKSITELHKGKISAKYIDDSLIIEVIL